MTRPKNVSRHTRAVLALFLERPDAWHYGYDLMKATGIASGTLYPMLKRLAERGYLEATWEPPAADGRPARHTYRLTSDGRTLARQLAVYERSAVGETVMKPRFGPS